MTQNKFCRIIDLPETQVLLMVVYDEEEDAFKTNITMKIDGVLIELGMGFKTEEAATNCLDNFSKEEADNMYKVHQSLINDQA